MRTTPWPGVAGDAELLAAQAPIGRAERFGLTPRAEGVAELKRSIIGNKLAGRTKFDHTSLRIFKPKIGWATWMRRQRPDGKVLLYNYFNRNPQPRDEPYSVQVRRARDVRGGQFTYDGHLGTDFACPIGTPIVAAAPGRVLRVACELDAGGRKVCVDHGDGLFTTHNHLSRALVAEGDTVARGQVVGLSGVSGMEFILFFPWVAPHLHYNTWLDATPTDPFALDDEASLWRQRNDPVPHDGEPVAGDDTVAPTEWDDAGVAAGIAACRDPEVRALLGSFTSLDRRAAELMIWRNYRSRLFEAFPSITATAHERRPVLDLPFRALDATGVAFPESGGSPNGR